MSDAVKPNHYKFKVRTAEGTTLDVDALGVIEGAGLSFSLGNVVKYVIRAGRKSPDPIEDLCKAREYLDREIRRLLAG